MSASGPYGDRRWCMGRCSRPAAEDHDAALYLACAVGDADCRDAPGGADRAARSRPEAARRAPQAPDAGAPGRPSALHPANAQRTPADPQRAREPRRARPYRCVTKTGGTSHDQGTESVTQGPAVPWPFPDRLGRARPACHRDRSRRGCGGCPSGSVRRPRRNLRDKRRLCGWHGTPRQDHRRKGKQSPQPPTERAVEPTIHLDHAHQ